MISIESNEIVIQVAKPEQAERINQITYLAWLKTYPNKAAGITIDDIESRMADVSGERLARRRKSLETPDKGTVTLVAIKDSKVVGHCRISVAEDKNRLNMMYVDPDYQGQGVGSKLWEASQEYLDPENDTLVDVVDYNTSAIRFYERLGFVDTGNRHQDERFRLKSGAIFTEMEMVRRKDSASRR